MSSTGATFEEWFGAQLPRLVRLATVLCGDRDLGEDVLQDVAVKAHARWLRLRELDQPEAYLRRMIVNEHLSWRRKWNRIIPSAELVDRTAVDPSHADQHADRAELVAELHRLPRRQKTVLVLRFFEDLTDAEIADLLGCTPSTVRTHAARGLATLRFQLIELRDHPEPGRAHPDRPEPAEGSRAH